LDDDRMNGCAFQERKGKVENENLSGWVCGGFL
jgi:hypothetical protein